MTVKNMYEIFGEFEKAATKADKIQVLDKNLSYPLRCVLRANFHPNIRFVIDKLPDYKPSDSPIGMGYMNMGNVIEKIYLFEKDNPRVSTNLTLERKTLLLVQILESLEAKEAEIFGAMILKKIKVKGLTAAIVKEAIPDINLES